MEMWLQATFTRDDLARALDELTPALLDLGQGRELTLEKPSVVGNTIAATPTLIPWCA